MDARRERWGCGHVDTLQAVELLATVLCEEEERALNGTGNGASTVTANGAGVTPSSSSLSSFMTVTALSLLEESYHQCLAEPSLGEQHPCTLRAMHTLAGDPSFLPSPVLSCFLSCLPCSVSRFIRLAITHTNILISIAQYKIQCTLTVLLARQGLAPGQGLAPNARASFGSRASFGAESTRSRASFGVESTKSRASFALDGIMSRASFGSESIRARASLGLDSTRARARARELFVECADLRSKVGWKESSLAALHCTTRNYTTRLLTDLNHYFTIIS